MDTWIPDSKAMGVAFLSWSPRRPIQPTSEGNPLSSNFRETLPPQARYLDTRGVGGLGLRGGMDSTGHNGDSQAVASESQMALTGQPATSMHTLLSSFPDKPCRDIQDGLCMEETASKGAKPFWEY